MHQSGNEVILLNANDLPQTTAPYSCKLRTFRAYFPVPHMKYFQFLDRAEKIAER